MAVHKPNRKKRESNPVSLSVCTAKDFLLYGFKMNKPGFTKAWRKELDSDIWKMPPLYYKVWRFLLNSVSWEKNIFPTRNLFGIHLNPGQQLFSIQIIIEGVAWSERNIIKRPNKKTILDILKWLEFNRMISRESNGNGTYISICNWDKYQQKENNKVTESIPQGIPESIPQSSHTKEVKEVKEVEEEKINSREKRKIFIPPTEQEVLSYCLDRKNYVNPNKFINHYMSNGWMVGKNKMKDWKAAVRTWESNGNGKTGQDKPKYDPTDVRSYI